jgi:hypothetical protein
MVMYYILYGIWHAGLYSTKLPKKKTMQAGVGEKVR